MRLGHNEDVIYLCSDNRCQQGRLIEPLCSKCLLDKTNPHFKENHKCINFPEALIDLA